VKNPVFHNLDIWLKNLPEHLVDDLDFSMIAYHQLVVPKHQVKIVQQESHTVSWLDLFHVELGILKLVAFVYPQVLNF
jgi:hypothetical protein